MLKLRTTGDPYVVRSRDIVDRQLAQLTRLVDDLLDAARITSGKIHIDRQRIALNDVVYLGAEGSHPLIEARRQSLAISMPDEPVLIVGDTTRLVQVLQNLLNNASKFSPLSSGIRVDRREEGEFVVLTVADNGRGISSLGVSTIFELPPGTKLDEGGLGIGLTLARAIVELHGGHLEAASSGVGTGSTFTVAIPKAPPETTVVSLKISEPAVAVVLRILVVDDNRDSADSMAILLEMMGHQVKAAYDGDHAIAPSFQPDVVLLDLSMPGMTGFEALPVLRGAVSRQVLIAAMTVLGSDDDKARTRAAGFDAHLTRPVELVQIGALLECAVKGAQ